MRKQFLSALAALLLGSQILLAIPARPGRIVHTQPDGSKIVLILHGDEFGHWTTDASGRLLRQDADGFYRVDTQNDLATVQRRAAGQPGPRNTLPSGRSISWWSWWSSRTCPSR